ncbi:Lipopolysaccharide-modifying protein [Macrophomina phaseolina MS6]|uniref:Lipopolysaccharide-modifying protein n=1 Tax=Macrophomina phaseolina (strain MS6) TaxID=1126212 RepID=K2S6D9_MACPH|nr:Lipopolysaccharide-modifying protein [Macrophomina phaseolina MS6]
METAVPIFIALAEWWFIQRLHRRSREQEDDDMDSTVYSDLFGGLATSNWKPLVSVALLSWSSYAAIVRASPAPSTYICSHVSREYSMIPRLQAAGVILDAFFSVILFFLVDPSSRSPWTRTGKGTMSLGLSCLISATVWIIIGAGVYFLAPPSSKSLISPTPLHFTSSAIKFAVEVSIAVVCALYAIRHIGLLNASILVLSTSAYVSLFLSTWNHSHPFPPLAGGMFLALTGMALALVVYSIPQISGSSTSHTASGPQSFSRYRGFYPVVAALYFFQLMFIYHGDNEVRYHPIDMLVYDAKERHDMWLEWASSSTSLEMAANNYTIRYGRHPPPHFDVWYTYATERSSRIIDDYDFIQQDLLPYWSLSPAVIRRHTWEAISDPSKGVAGILLRSGKARVAPNVPRNQRLMLDGIVKMIDKFGNWLPDMDLAFNLNNECRVALPYEEIEALRTEAELNFSNEEPASELVNDFSDDRAKGWQELSKDTHDSDHFVTLSSHSIWDEFGSITCPSDSPVRTQRIWNRQSLCTSCALPHSLGAFFANWTLEADICYQPDLVGLHGFYTSPNVFIGTHTLLPIFSQSKAPGFSDILYPSAWDYMDRVPYAPSEEHPDPPFEDKKPTVFWRGATSEGFAAADSTAWHGMTRQRMVHTLSITNTSQVIPLPHPVANYRRKLRYVPVPPALLRNSTPVDVAVSDVVRCAEPACTAERALFLADGSAQPEKVDFQDHWQHRYLLDADGAGFSGRFLAFLQSHSMPIKVAPLFREWWHGRVTPWLHFVPVDPRLQGLWATMTYFSGFKGVVDGKEVEWKGKGDREGKRIAEEGRDWAAKALRTEDMEIYFFRLLLEWGRLTDDNRARIGRQAPHSPPSANQGIRYELAKHLLLHSVTYHVLLGSRALTRPG